MREGATTHNHAGGSLVISLLFITFLTISIVSFFASVTSERIQSASHSRVDHTNRLVDIAAQEAMGKIVSGFEDISSNNNLLRGSVTASPGLMEILRFDLKPNRGSATGSTAFVRDSPSGLTHPFATSYAGQPANPRWIPLFSHQLFAPSVPFLTIMGGNATEPNPDFNPAALFDFNTVQNPFRPGQHYLSGQPGKPRAMREDVTVLEALAGTATATSAYAAGRMNVDLPVWAQWIAVHENPTEPPSSTNPIVGRYAYWIDVENTKLHLETASRPLRQTPWFPHLTGESDAAVGAGASSFSQSFDNPFHQLRLNLEGQIAGKDGVMRNGSIGPGSNLLAASTRDWLLDWQGAERPFVADTSVVDWDYFSSLQSAFSGQDRIALGDVFSQIARERERGQLFTLNETQEVLALLDPAIMEDPARARWVVDTVVRCLGPSVTVHGYENEIDPLGRARIDLVKFLIDGRSQYSGALGNPLSLRGTELWSRLGDSAYHNAYYPGAYASNGQSRSFFRALSPFAGNGNRNDLVNGEVGAFQMLLNVFEYTQPDHVPPHVDTVTGLVGARSIPYVAEIATRARSAIWLLPEEDRENPDKLLETDGSGNLTYEFEGKGIAWYLTNIVVDLAVAFLNPDPFARREFDGLFELDYFWLQPPSGHEVVPQPEVKPLRGRYNIIPVPGDKPGDIRVDGKNLYYDLGTLPGSVLLADSHARVFNIHGWKIRDNNGLWHEVPIRHPRAMSAGSWWQMAQYRINAGAHPGIDQNSLAVYQEDGVYRSVGWFSRSTCERLGVHHVYVDDEDGSLFVGGIQADEMTRLQDFIERANRHAIVERVYSLDPVLGHRTGNLNLVGYNGKDSFHNRGHFYGVLGHTWRHHDVGAQPYDPAKPIPPVEPEVLTLSVGEDLSSAHQTKTITVNQENGLGYESNSRSVSVSTAGFSNLRTATATIWSTQERPHENVDALTGFFSDPSWEIFPLGFCKAGKYTKAAVYTMEETDIETLAPPSATEGFKERDLRKQARSFMSMSTRGELMTSVGELGMVHSGFPNMPILLSGALGSNEWLLNSPQNGPPMRMLLDLFNPGAFNNTATGALNPRQSWESGNYRSYSPSNPRQGTWNVNSMIAHDSYMAIREGDSQKSEFDKESDPAGQAAHVVWLPNAAGFKRNPDGDESHRGSKAEELLKHRTSMPLDRFSQPFPSLPRAWMAWSRLLSGDFSTDRNSAGLKWGFNNSAIFHQGAGGFTWRPGRGVAVGESPFADFDPDQLGFGKLLTFGTDGRKKAEPDKGKINEKDGFLKGRFAADQNLEFLLPISQVRLPLSRVTRFTLFPMRHFRSDLAVDYTYPFSFIDFKTALNPRAAAMIDSPSGVTEVELKGADGNSFPGGYHASGIFQNAPIALMANQASTSSNVFTVHIIAQTIRDKGTVREGIERSGIGYHDPDDQVLSETWARMVFSKLPPRSDEDQANRFRVLHYQILDNQ